jgi:filamentous hemagglutinin
VKSAGSLAVNVIPEIHIGKQGKHIPGHNNFVPGRSKLLIDPRSLTAQVGTGKQVGKIPVGQPGSKERVVFDDIIGVYIDQTGASSPTRVGVIHYSKSGIHIVPGRPN